MGFRDALCSEARRLGVLGWVRNRRDGSVEALLSGSPEAVAALTSWARRGPPAAQVRLVAVEELPEADPVPRGFERLPSA